MFDIGWSEMAVIAIVALVVIGPKDLPRALKTVGLWVRKARSISREFQGHVDQMIREAELDELREQVEKVGKVDLQKEFEKTVDPSGSLAEAMKPVELPDLKSAFDPNAPATPSAAPPAIPAPDAPPDVTPAPEAPPAAIAAPDAPPPASPGDPAKPVEPTATEPAPVEKTGTTG